ncbi:hypothetical protein ARTHRO9AX_20007 [Arthrobacter sp. 9AX]|nr:hypothetical protein ARTHRO9AX_20007 [Arthrobacter sp. 9AX]
MSYRAVSFMRRATSVDRVTTQLSRTGSPLRMAGFTE